MIRKAAPERGYSTDESGVAPRGRLVTVRGRTTAKDRTNAHEVPELVPPTSSTLEDGAGLVAEQAEQPVWDREPAMEQPVVPMGVVDASVYRATDLVLKVPSDDESRDET